MVGLGETWESVNDLKKLAVITSAWSLCSQMITRQSLGLSYLSRRAVGLVRT